ncbi:GNAT family N-acetyltransferase [Clostridium homopropionicum]|uniref:GNAT family N-acetyltransferase n=1 Tax=Clostridium homopropionicum TaxID=36844 RepID=UPI00068C01FA
MLNIIIAIEGDEPVGVILGGIKNYEGIKTIRCGTLALSSNYRGLGISNALYNLHKDEALQKKS